MTMNYPTLDTKAQMLALIADEQQFWHTLVAEVGADRTDIPGVNNGAWTFKDVAAHLNYWRRWSVARMIAGRDSTDPVLPANVRDETDVDAINADAYAADRDRPLADILAETDAQFLALHDAVAATPEEVLTDPHRFAWMHGSPLGEIVLGHSYLHLHEDHEPDIRAWLARTPRTA